MNISKLELGCAFVSSGFRLSTDSQSVLGVWPCSRPQFFAGAGQILQRSYVIAISDSTRLLMEVRAVWSDLFFAPTQRDADVAWHSTWPIDDLKF